MSGQTPYPDCDVDPDEGDEEDGPSCAEVSAACHDDL